VVRLEHRRTAKGADVDIGSSVVPLEGFLCQDRETAYLKIEGLGRLYRAEPRSRIWLIRFVRGTDIDVTPFLKASAQEVIVRLPLAHLPVDGKGRVVVSRTSMIAGSTELPVHISSSLTQKPQRLKGNIASITRADAVFGWACDPHDRTNNVPIEVRADGRLLLGLANWDWPVDNLRKFSVKLPASVGDGALSRIDAETGFNRRALRRSPFFAMRTRAGWLLSAPIRASENTMEGAMFLPNHRDVGITLQLLLPDGRTFVAKCDRNAYGGYNFGGVNCGFRIEAHEQIDLRRSEIVLLHQSLEAPLSIPLSAIRPEFEPARQTSVP
jgi:hypothetical protein